VRPTGGKIIFLDFDGVLNNSPFLYSRDRKRRGPNDDIDEKNVEELNWLIKQSGAWVVVSSIWRMNRSRVQLQETLAEKGFKGTVLSATPDLDHVPNITRGQEIDAWMRGNRRFFDVTSFVILDDHDDMGPLTPKLVLTDSSRGLTRVEAELALEILGAV
jgi:hypothetical protein